MKRIFFALLSVLFLGLVLPSVWGKLSYTAGPNAATPHYVKCSACQQNFWRCVDAEDHSLQASCSTDTNCLSTNFYQCQHTAHEYSVAATDPNICPQCGQPH